MDNKKELIYEIKRAPLESLTIKQLKSLVKIVNEYLKVNGKGENIDVNLMNEIIKFREDYYEYLKDAGFVSNGIEYSFLYKLNKIIGDEEK